MKHVRIYHRENHAALQKELAERAQHSRNCPKPQHHLNKVQTSALNLQLQSLRLISEHGHAFKLLDDDAFQQIIQPMIDAMPAANR